MRVRIHSNNTAIREVVSSRYGTAWFQLKQGDGGKVQK